MNKEEKENLVNMLGLIFLVAGPVGIFTILAGIVYQQVKGVDIFDALIPINVIGNVIVYIAAICAMF